MEKGMSLEAGVAIRPWREQHWKITMPQLQLPIFPAGAKEINRNVAVQCRDGRVAYFHGQLPVFQHDEKSVKSFRFFTSQM